MAKSLITRIFGVPSQNMPELTEPSDKIARLSEAKYAFETKRRKLEHQFEVTNSHLREEYLSEVLEIHDSPRRRTEANMLTTRDLIRIRYIIWKVRAWCWLVERLRARAGRPER